jgi:hypothetical protein
MAGLIDVGALAECFGECQRINDGFFAILFRVMIVG